LAVLVLAVLALMAAVGLARVAGTLSASSGDATPPSADQPAPPRAGPGEVYVVQPGDTYWTIAAQLSPGDDPRPIVDRLQEANGGASLDVGDRLVLDVE
jgi:Tfp pilus assembly protein FimV